jgi:hypothetical protein
VIDKGVQWVRALVGERVRDTIFGGEDQGKGQDMARGRRLIK